MDEMNDKPKRGKIGIIAMIFVIGLGVYFVRKSKQAGQPSKDGESAQTTETPESQQGGKSDAETKSKVVDSKALPGPDSPGVSKVEQSKATKGELPKPGVETTPGSLTKTEEPAKIEEPKPACKTVTFQLKKTDKTDMDSPVQIIKLPVSASQLKGICLRVGGDPVPFQKAKDKADELVIRRVMEETKEIVAAWCETGQPCKIECKAKRDEFMSALAGEESPEDIQGELLKDNGWGDAKSADNDRKIAKEMSELADALRELQKQKGLRVPTWQKSQESAGCEAVAKK